MLRIFQGFIFLFAVGTLFLISGCTVQEHAIEIQKDMEFLTSDEAAGRLPGIAGNELTRDYIAEQFQAAGLDFYNGSEDYFQEYEQEIHDPEKQTQVLEVTFSDGTKKEYRAGKDIPSILDKTAEGVSGELTWDMEDPKIEDKIFVQKMDEEAKSPESCHGILQQSERLVAIAISTDIPLIKIPTDVFEEIGEGGISLKINGQLHVEKKMVQNVIGVKKGAEGKNAIVVGAHFDHVGGYGEKIYHGALDNASGTSVLLDLVRKSAEKNFPSLENDLIFCAFNSEDSGFLGSSTFVESLSGYKTINMLNIDCVGAPSVGQLATGTDGNVQLEKKLLDYFKRAAIPCGTGVESISDEGVFLGAGYPAIGLATQNEVEVNHTQNDTIEKIDCDMLGQLSSALPGFLAELDKDLVPMKDADPASADGYHITYQDIPRDIQQQAKEEGRRLVKEYQVGYDEMIYFPFQGFYFYTSGNYPIQSVKEVQERYPDLEIPDQINGLQFQSFVETFSDGSAILDAESEEDLPKEPTVRKGYGSSVMLPTSFVLIYKDKQNGSAFSVSVSDQSNSHYVGEEEEPVFPAWNAHPECTIQPDRDDSQKASVLVVPGAGESTHQYWVTKLPSAEIEQISDIRDQEMVPMTEQDMQTVYQGIREALEPVIERKEP